MSTLRNKVALITGAAQGIGAETARTLAREGSKVVLVDLDADKLRALAAELGDRRALAHVADVRDLSSMQHAVDAGIQRFGRLDFAIANAGSVCHSSIVEGDPHAFQETVDINIVGVFHTVRAALPALIESQGYVLIVSSLAAYVASPGAAAYDTCQAGVERFASVLRLEVAHLGVDVGSAHMSWVETPLIHNEEAVRRSYQPLFDRQPAPRRATFSLRTCATAFAQGLDQRRRRVNVP